MSEPAPICARCGRPLTDPESIKRGLGPCCAQAEAKLAQPTLPGAVDDGRERLPSWTAAYLTAWGSPGPRGQRVTVNTAAEAAGVTPRAVQLLRERSATFARLEDMVRHGDMVWAAGFAQAGIRALLPETIAALADLVAIRDPQTVRQVMKWAMGDADLNVNVKHGPAAWDLEDFLEATRRAEAEVREFEAELLDNLDPAEEPGED